MSFKFSHFSSNVAVIQVLDMYIITKKWPSITKDISNNFSNNKEKYPATICVRLRKINVSEDLRYVHLRLHYIKMHLPIRFLNTNISIPI